MERVLVLTEITKTLITLYFTAGRTISNRADLRTAGHADPSVPLLDETKQ
jgi:hypothetical protein